MSKYIKSPLNYIGGKHKILDKIMPMFPQNITSFVDLFAGGLNVGINISADTIYVNEHITYLIELYEYFRKVSTEDLLSNIKGRISEYRLTNTNQEGYLELRREYNNSKNILDLFVLTCFSFNHQIRFNSKHEFNIPFGKERSSYNSSIEANLVQFVQALKEKNYVFVNGDFAKFDFEKIRKGDFVYCDPPYLITNGSYNDGKRGFKDWTMKEEEELLELLDSLDRKGILFALSNVFYHKGASNDLLIEWSKKYYTHYIDKNYSNCSYQLKDRKAKTIEVLITNFEGSQDNVR
jgi:modification methylase fokI